MAWSFIARLVSNVLGSVYPAYASYRALLSGRPEEQKQWLVFWLVNTFFVVLELVADTLVSWLPLYFEAKIAFLLWLVVGGGASILYNNFVKIFLEKYEEVIDAHVDRVAELAADRGGAVLGQVATHGTKAAALGLQWLAGISPAAGPLGALVASSASSAAAAAASGASTGSLFSGTAGSGAASSGAAAAPAASAPAPSSSRRME